ncbi:hypothetical protein SEA_STROSAHL_62 [Gordonia phage Strosahl]|uniref:DUF3310 domain-containing protein n=2 Tax=Soupsvirus strosahl TaxID=2560510 RepID=A0A1B3B172_9CAUD|nr:nucleotide kinase [Gordonia phage Remus]YP_009596263.1 nucleotide kinase [Gordonia phage Strosahl]AOE44672.1 hypothetical protein SEA_REMUS_62 [Gordonia phage Remus]AOE44773.1 hypothetical protein SEA_STROSAHL_62 [Gordonia phage Strosahl]
MTETRVHVDHYASSEIETIDFIADKLGPEGFKAYVLGNIMKYASRAQFKGVFDDDLEKIRNYAVILQERQAKSEAVVSPPTASWPALSLVPYGTLVQDSTGDWYRYNYALGEWKWGYTKDDIHRSVTASWDDGTEFAPYTEVIE